MPKTTTMRKAAGRAALTAGILLFAAVGSVGEGSRLTAPTVDEAFQQWQQEMQQVLDAALPARDLQRRVNGFYQETSPTGTLAVGAAYAGVLRITRPMAVDFGGHPFFGTLLIESPGVSILNAELYRVGDLPTVLVDVPPGQRTHQIRGIFSLRYATIHADTALAFAREVDISPVQEAMAAHAAEYSSQDFLERMRQAVGEGGGVFASEEERLRYVAALDALLEQAGYSPIRGMAGGFQFDHITVYGGGDVRFAYDVLGAVSINYSDILGTRGCGISAGAAFSAGLMLEQEVEMAVHDAARPGMEVTYNLQQLARAQDYEALLRPFQQLMRESGGSANLCLGDAEGLGFIIHLVGVPRGADRLRALGNLVTGLTAFTFATGQGAGAYPDIEIEGGLPEGLRVLRLATETDSPAMTR